MDKFEYKVRADEIKALIAEGEFAEAVKIADSIDWRRVKSVMMLCTISDLYKINRRYQESKDILLLAYEKHPTGRLIIYSLCELSIKMEEYVQALEYYKEYVQIAPKDTGRYILQYRLYEAQDVSLEERIAVLEEFKKRDYREKWAYELAYLYHRIGLSTKCVEECDEMFLWFGEGKYVIKALELKKLHEPLNADQQDKYDLWMQAKESEAEPYEEEAVEEADTVSEDIYAAGESRYREEERAAIDSLLAAEAPTTELPEVKTVDVGQYNTINLQMALAESMREILSEEETAQQAPDVEPMEGFHEEKALAMQAGEEDYMQEASIMQAAEENYVQEAPMMQAEEESYVQEAPIMQVVEESPVREPSIEEPLTTQVPGTTESEGKFQVEQSLVPETMDIEEDNAVTEELAAEAPMVDNTAKKPVTPIVETSVEQPTEEMQEEDTGELDDDAITRSLIAPLLEETIRLPDSREIEKRLHKTSVTSFPQKETVQEASVKKKPVVEADHLQEIGTQVSQEDMAAFDAQKILEQMKEEVLRRQDTSDESRVPGARTGVLTPLNTKPSKYDNILSQEYDGQISLVMPEAERIEKQITGQLSIEDIMAEWEEMKKTNEQKRMEDVRQRILAHTGNIFADFDEATKNGLLEELERAFVAAIMKESGRKPAIKKVIMPDDADKKPETLKKAEPEPEPLMAEDVEDLSDEPDFKEEADEPEMPEEEPAMDVSLPEEEPVEESLVETEEEPELQENEGIKERELTEEEKELFGEFIHHRKTERQLIRTLDNMSLAPYTGNVLITGEEEETSLALAKALIKEMQLGDSNFSGKVAKISAVVLNKKDIEEIFVKLDNGALVIEKASRLRAATIAKMIKALDKDNMGLIVLMIDQKQDMNHFLEENPALSDHFNLRVDVEALDDEALVAYAKQYAEEMEYSIDEFGILALHTRIADRQTSDHEVNLAEVRDLVDEAIYYANKKTPGHFMDILLAKRYDEDDMIILREKDFMHY